MKAHSQRMQGWLGHLLNGATAYWGHTNNEVGENVKHINAKGSNQKKKRERSGQADPLGRPPPPLPQSGQENVKKILTLIFDFRFWLYMTQNEF